MATPKLGIVTGVPAGSSAADGVLQRFSIALHRAVDWERKFSECFLDGKHLPVQRAELVSECLLAMNR